MVAIYVRPKKNITRLPSSFKTRDYGTCMAINHDASQEGKEHG